MFSGGTISSRFHEDHTNGSEHFPQRDTTKSGMYIKDMTCDSSFTYIFNLIFATSNGLRWVYTFIEDTVLFITDSFKFDRGNGQGNGRNDK